MSYVLVPIHVPKHLRHKLSDADLLAIDEDYDDYLSYGGRFLFEAWLKHYHSDIHTKLYAMMGH